MALSKRKVMLVDDETYLTKVLSLALQNEGYEVESASNGPEALRKLAEFGPDAVVLDVMMPRMDGWETCRRMRQISAVPIMMLTAKAGEANEIRGLTCGADQYMTKPFPLSLLVARLNALMRRSGPSTQPSEQQSVKVGGLEVDLSAGEARVDGQRVDLSPTEFRLLSALASKPGQIVTHRELLTQVWGTEYAEEHAYLKLYVRYLRQKIESDPARPRYVMTRRGHGYLLSDGLASDSQEPGDGFEQAGGLTPTGVSSAA